MSKPKAVWEIHTNATLYCGTVLAQRPLRVSLWREPGGLNLPTTGKTFYTQTSSSKTALCFKLLLRHSCENKCTTFQSGWPELTTEFVLAELAWISVSLSRPLSQFSTFITFTLICILTFCLPVHLVLFCFTPLGVCLISLIAHLCRSPELNPELTEEVARPHHPLWKPSDWTCSVVYLAGKLHIKKLEQE